MVIVETRIFARQVQQLLTDEEYSALQWVLASRPAAGALIPGGGGLRKVRWAVHGRGKRGGVRVIYYWAVGPQQLLMLFMYSKSAQDDLSADQIRILREIIEEEYP